MSLLHLHNRSSRMTQPDEPVTLTFSAPSPCGCVTVWTQVFGDESVPTACGKAACSSKVRGILSGQDESPPLTGAGNTVDGLSDPLLDLTERG